MATANSQHGNTRRVNEFRKPLENLWPVVIEVAQRATENDRVRLKVSNSIVDLSHVNHARCRLFHQPINIACYILQSQRRYLTFALAFTRKITPPIMTRQV